MIHAKIIKAIFDKLFALVAIIVLFPVFFIAAIGIKLSSDGPILYKASRMGKDMIPIVIYKFRSMHTGSDSMSAITGTNDTRVFPWGEILRKTKVDELPQLFNVLFGTMSIVGPRPEDIQIVKEHYTPSEIKTLSVLPGLACPGSIFHYTHGSLYISDTDPEKTYIQRFLHIKLALDLYYLSHWSLLYDLRIIFRTISAILHTFISKKPPQFPIEYVAIFGNK